ncbi:MAG: UvrD-helicase domain-containing protein, partial [Oscillospiraceae bacterium]|nr:UvrD-helicase domain-containing protein [Oscillospiraceae bacterium]
EKPTPLAAQIRGEYRAVMVDEYQDTNRLQDTLYRCLAAPDGSNLFLVGDMKQSIYRFRQADPTVFQEKKRDFRDYSLRTEPDPQPDFGVGGAGPARALKGWRIMMNNNFRSAPGVIEAINGIMGEVMTGEVGGVNYRYDHGEQLAQPPAPADYRGGCELCLVDGSSDAGYTAARIREMLNSGFRVRDGGDTRPCRPEDFAILLRSWNGVEEYTAALEENGLRACCNTREDLLDSPVLRPLVNLLRVLDNPAQDVALASVLLSPLGGMTNTELTALRAARPGGSLYRAILPPEEPQAAPPAVDNGVQSDPGPRSTAPVTGAEAKAEAFYHWLSGLRDLARTLPVDRLLDEILARTGYAALAGAMPGGEARRDELQRFVDLCCSLGGQGLAELVRRLDALAEQGAVSGSGAVSRPGCVSVMTVHGSKGLEFPVVFYARMSKQFNLQDAAKPVLFHPEWGIGLKLRGPGGTYATLRYVQVARCIRTESISEEMRVFYVALTRAKDRLILSVPVKGGETGKLVQHALEVRRTLSQPRCPGDWAVAAALSNRESGLLQDLLPKEYREAAGCGEWPLEIRMAQEPEAAPELREDTRNAVPDAQLAAALAEGFAWRYPHAVRTGLAAKVSVTGLVHRNDEVHMERPAFMQKDGMTGAEKGTATHAFLQHADLALAGRDLQAEVRRQVELELMAADTAEKLDWPALEHFFQSGLYRRIQQADRVLREYDFISAVPAAALVESDADKAQLDPQRDTVLIQGVADLVLVTGEGVEIVDYKTDRGKSAERLVAAYEKQLRLYARALGRRFSPLPVVKCTIYSFWLRTELDVPLRSL